MRTAPVPNKTLGQHWLHDDASLDAMCDAIQLTPGDTVLEIGPGLGTLTAKLIERGAQVVAVEFDTALARELPTLVVHKNLQVIEHDILTFDFGKLPKGYKVAANIPYYLTSNLLRVMSESINPFTNSALLVQKEVAERVVSQPGAMSLLSVSVQFYCAVSLGMVVPAELFTPPPKVDSQILQLQYREKPLYEDVDSKEFFRIVKAGFSERRKKLRSSLSGGLRISKVEAEDILRAAGIDPGLRPQALSLEDWHRLYLQVKT